ncbi:MAG: 3'(2'),5'-bisphosphate nucleotidase CysQ [Bacteroidaceae bacterium]|nr:3'(2'),5'-bisphosphate nucleotidase CysQ [Bacteroidaceae bacterium]
MEAYLKTAICASLDAGRDIMDIYEAPAQDFGIERKADNSPLTLADKAAHRRIMQHLEPLRLPILSEEGQHLPFATRSRWNALWIVDPLDGTKEFIKKNGEFTVNIALVREGKPLLGVVYVPANGDLYYASLGAAYKTSVPCRRPFPPVEDILAAAQPLPLANEARKAFVIVASRSHMNAETEAYVAQQRKTHSEVVLVSSGSSIKICLVAEGRADAYPRFAPTMEWDTAAGDAIARAAGCCVIDPQTGRPLRYNKEDLLNPWFLVRR